MVPVRISVMYAQPRKLMGELVLCLFNSDNILEGGGGGGLEI